MHLQRALALNNLFPPRNIDDAVKAKVGNISPYRQLVSLDKDGNYKVTAIPDTEEIIAYLPDNDETLGVVLSSRPMNKLYPSDASVGYALALAGMGIASCSNILCADSACMDMSTFSSEELCENALWLYSDDEALSKTLAMRFDCDMFYTTYRKQIIWHGNVPRKYASKCLRMENARRHRLMVSKLNHVLRFVSYENDQVIYFGGDHLYNELDWFELSQALRRLSAGIIDYDLRPPDGAEYIATERLSPIEEYMEKNVTFSNLDLDDESLYSFIPNYEAIKGLTNVWKSVVLKNSDTTLAELLRENVEDLAEEYGIESYADALVDGVPVEDLLA